MRAVQGTRTTMTLAHRRGLIPWLVLFLLPTAIGLPLSGCNRPAATAPTTRGEKTSDEALDTARETLRKDTGLTSCQTAVQQLNAYLSRNPDPNLRESIAAKQEERARLGNPVGL